MAEKAGIRLIMLGCGTSMGVPMIGCRCPVCQSPNPRNHRTRSSILLNVEGRNILVDTSPDLHSQALRHKMNQVDAVLFTHCHADHVNGIDELRIYQWRSKHPIPCYAGASALTEIRQRFEHLFIPHSYNGGQPILQPHTVDGPFSLFGLPIIPVELPHGDKMVLGFRFYDTAYLTDCNAVPGPARRTLHGVRTAIIDALRPSPHTAHFSLEEAIAAAEGIGAEHVIFTHMGHQLDYEETNAQLPSHMELGYDGLTLEIGTQR